SLARRLDSDAQVAGDAVQLPQLSVQFHLETALAMRNVSLVATGDRQSYSGWKRLERELKAVLAGLEVKPNPPGFTFLTFGLIRLGWPLKMFPQTPAQVAPQQLRDLLRM